MIVKMTETITETKEVEVNVEPFFSGNSIVSYELDSSGYLFRAFIFNNFRELQHFIPGSREFSHHINHAMSLPPITEDEWLDNVAIVLRNNKRFKAEVLHD